MKRILLPISFCLLSLITFGQSASEAPVQNISTDTGVVYRLFATKNMYNFIKLNTRTGQMWQVQWGLESKYQFQSTLSAVPRINKDEEKNGRFFLYPTTNTYNFILLDQIDGRAWQVQWSFDVDKRLVEQIF